MIGRLENASLSGSAVGPTIFFVKKHMGDCINNKSFSDPTKPIPFFCQDNVKEYCINLKPRRGKYQSVRGDIPPFPKKDRGSNSVGDDEQELCRANNNVSDVIDIFKYKYGNHKTVPKIFEQVVVNFAQGDDEGRVICQKSDGWVLEDPFFNCKTAL